MKLHLNLTLRRAVLAAMALVALQPTEAKVTASGGNLYITETESPDSSVWNQLWKGNKGVLTVGTSQGTGSLILTSGNFTTPGGIFIGGVGYGTNAATANDGTITVEKGAKLTAGTQLNVGSSQKTSTGNLVVKGGQVDAGSEFSVGVYNGKGVVTVTDGGKVTVSNNKGSAIFRMGHMSSGSTADFTGSSITVGSKNGPKDYTSIGHSGSAVLTLTGSTATFADQTIVGEQGGGNGTIHVHGGSQLNMTGTTTLGYADNATGTICGENGSITSGILEIGAAGKGLVELTDSTLQASYITLGNARTGNGSITAKAGSSVSSTSGIEVGNAGKGSITLSDSSTLSAPQYITVGDEAGSNGTITSNGGTISTRLLTIGDAGTGTVTTSGTLTASEIVLGNATTGSGTLNITGGSVSKIDKLYAGYQGTGTLTTASNVTATNMYVVGAGSSATATGGTLTSSNATVVGGTLATSGTGKLDIAKATIAAGGKLSLASENNKITDLGIAKGASATFEKDANALISGTLLNDGEVTIKSGAIMASSGSATNAGAINNEGSLYIHNGGSMTNLGTISGENGSISNRGSLTLGGTTHQAGVSNFSDLIVTGELNASDAITNNGSITIQGAGRIDAEELLTENNGTLTIVVDKTTTSTGADEAVIALDKATKHPVTVSIDTANASALVGKKVDFLMEDGNLMEVGKLIGLDQTTDFILKGNSTATFDWEHNRITAEIGGADMQISFTQSTGSGNGLTTGMKFDKVTAAETYEVETPETTDNVDITLEVVTETVEATAETETLDEQKTTIDQEASTVLSKDDVVQKTEINQGYHDDGKTEKRTNVIIGKNVQSDNSQGSTSVQTVVANQVTTVTKTDNQGTTTTDTKKETVGTGGLALVFDGNTTHKSEANKGKDEAHMGFEEGTSGTVITKDEQDNDVENVLAKVDVVKINEGATVTLEDLNMHSTHSIEAKNATIILDGADVHIGGSVDPTMFETVTVTVYDEDHKPVLGADGKPLTKEVQVESKHHVSVNSQLAGSTIELKNGATLDFKVVDGDEHHTQHLGSATLEDTTVVLTESTLGGKKTEEGDDYEYMEIQLTGDKSHLKGTGHVKKVNMKGGHLSVGNSPGVLNVTDSKFDRTNVNFYFITNSDAWNFNGTTTDTTKGSGAISQLNINESVTLTNVPVNILFEHLVEGTVDTYTQSTGAQIAALASQFKEGAEIQLITGLENLTPDSTYTSVSGLPELEDGLFWDTSTLFKDGIIRIYGEILEEPVRVANSLVSAGENVLGFGRLAVGQGKLREAGTTRTWGSAISNFDSVDHTDARTGYDYNSWGAAVGVDHAFTKRTLVGAAFGRTYGENKPDQDNGYYSGGTIDQDATMLGLYGAHKFRTKGMLNDMRLNAFAAYGWFENDSKRNGLRSGNTATAEWDSTAWVLSASLSRDITTDDGLVITPYVGVEYTSASMDDFTETGAHYDADYTADKDYSKLSVKVGATVSKTFGSVTPYAGIAYINDVQRDTPEVTAAGRRVITDKASMPGRSAVQLNVGANWQITDSWDLNAGYTAEIRDKATQHDVNVGVGYTF
ncbi:MAG: autotransporter domain-containing protein [Akkermansia sp.]|nr:autotransporter domain-containing protein [Akkermansia sp.]